jgi:hypothetical protein
MNVSSPSLRFWLVALAWVAVTLLSACTPTFNWREVRFEEDVLVALLPCKPDRAERSVPFAGVDRRMQVMGCESGGAMFAVSRMVVTDGAGTGAQTQAQEALVQLQAVNEKTLVLDRSVSATLRVPGADTDLAMLVVGNSAANKDKPQRSHALYFRKGGVIYWATVLGEPKTDADGPGALSAQALETFLNGMRFAN